MPSSYDSVHALGVESAAEGGTQTRTSPTEMDPQQDAVAAAALHVIGTGIASTDKTVYVDRSASSLRLSDNTTQRLLSELVTSVQGGVNAHSAIRDIQHFLAGEGPGDGFSSGCTLQRSYSGILLTSEIWYSAGASPAKIISRTISYTAGTPFVSSVSWALYAANGSVVRQLTDSYAYSGPLCVSASRTWS